VYEVGLTENRRRRASQFIYLPRKTSKSVASGIRSFCPESGSEEQLAILDGVGNLLVSRMH
jgi:hypothetical protein